MAVNTEVSVDKDIADIEDLFFLYLTISSAAKCWASAALPPFPQKSILLPFLDDFNASTHNNLKIL